MIVGLGVGGAELMLKRLIESHHSDPLYQHSVISLTTLGKIGPELRGMGIKVSVMNMRSALQFPATIWRLRKILRDSSPDIVHTWMYHADLLGGLAARAAGIRTVIWGIRTTDVFASEQRATSAVRWLCARLSYWVPHTIVCAAEASRNAHVSLGYCSNRMVVVSNGFDLSRLQVNPTHVAKLRTECGLGRDAVVVGLLARFSPDKDQYNFVRAAGLLARKLPKARFLMVGRDCQVTNNQLMEWINATGCAASFVLLGERSDAPTCLAAMDIFCLSSRTEGFPNVVGEAMALRKPCVVTDVGDAAYLLGGCGVVVPMGDSDALAEGLIKLASLSDFERDELGDLAHARIASEFTMERARKRFEAVYANVLAEEPATLQRGSVR